MVHDDARYLVGVVSGRVVACGAIQVIAPEVAEIKRMYAGYGEIPVYGEYLGNPYSVCFEKRLRVDVR